jgi:hypothetical protein
MSEFSGGDFEGFDAASVGSIETDMSEISHPDLPDPVDGADASGPAFGDAEMSGGSVVDAVPGDDLIMASDGTTYEGYADFVAGADPFEPLS